MFKQDEREVLTYQKISKKLQHSAKANIAMSVVFLILFSFLSLCMFFITKGIVRYIVLALLDIPFGLFCIASIVMEAIKLYGAKNGEFSVVRERLEYVEASKPSFRQFLFWILTQRGFVSREYYLRHIFHFESGKEYIISVNASMASDVAAEFSMPGDTFFVVFFNSRPNKIALVYNEKIYNYKP